MSIKISIKINIKQLKYYNVKYQKMKFSEIKYNNLSCSLNSFTIIPDNLTCILTLCSLQNSTLITNFRKEHARES